MTTSNLTAERLRELLHYDPETGLFTRIVKTANRVKVGDVAGCVNGKGYILIGIDGQRFKASHLAWLYMTGTWPEYHIDHINHSTTDDRITNLRDVSQSTNMQNLIKAKITNFGGLLGASIVKKTGRWRAKIYINGRSKNLGCFNTPEEAHAAYVAEKRLSHAGCTI